MRAGRHADALAAYIEGSELLELLSDSAAVLLSDRLKVMTRTLRRDLHSNAAQAALHLEEWDSALDCASEALGDEAGYPKALYRRAAAYLGRAAEGDAERAAADLEALLHATPGNGAAQLLLRRARDSYYGAPVLRTSEHPDGIPETELDPKHAKELRN